MSFIPGRLDSDEIIDKLKALLSKDFHLTDDELNNILQKFWHQDAYNSLISYPAYLEHLIVFLNQKRTTDFTRSDFLLFMVQRIISDENLLQKVIELAVIMDLIQANETEPEKISSIFTQLGVDTPEKVIDNLKSKALLEDRTIEEKQYIGFCHHSIQEFLATQFILASQNPLKTAKQLVVLEQEGITTVKPSWYNVIRFLLESPVASSITKWLFTLAQNNPQVIEKGFSNTLTSVEPEKTPKKIQSQIFDLIYQTYQQRAVWLPLWTRQNLAKLCQPHHLKQLRKDIEPTKDKTVTFVHQGTVVDILSRLLENNSPLMTQEEKEFWKPKLIEFANDTNENGVLQRHALAALSTYNDPQIIPQVTKSFEHSDKLVREAFIQFCYATDPNHKLTVKYLVEGIKKGIDIYGRHGIYEITNLSGVKELLTYFAKDEAFLKRFLDRESIFNKDDRKGDEALIDHIKQNLNSEITSLLKEIVKAAYQASDIYHHERSYFLEQLIEIIFTNDQDYLFETVKDIKESDKNRWHLLCNYEELFAQIVRPDQLTNFFDEVKKLDENRARVAELTVYKAKHRREKDGEELYLKAVELGLVEPLQDQPQQYPDRNEELYKEFLKLLEPTKGRYFPTVFGFFIRHHKELQPFITDENTQRLAKLVVDEGLKKIDPTQIKVTINWGSEQSGRNFSISNVSSYYGDLLRTAQKLLPPESLLQYRQNIINFVPFAFSEDQQTILEIVEPVKDSELRQINQQYLDKENDIRYLIPSSYIYLVKRHLDKGVKLQTTLPILKSLVEDEKLPNHDREYALRQVEGLISIDDNETKELLEKLFQQYEGDPTNEKLAIIANKILINVYHKPEAINWRFNQLKERLVSFKEPPLEIGHWIGPIEEELDSKWFARPLINLKSDTYIDDFLDLLEFSFEQIPLAEQNNYWPYIKYLWAVVIAYFENLKHQGSFNPLKQLEAWLEENAKGEGLNWLKAQARDLYLSYEQHFGTATDITEAVTTLKKLKNHE